MELHGERNTLGCPLHWSFSLVRQLFILHDSPHILYFQERFLWQPLRHPTNVLHTELAGLCLHHENHNDVSIAIANTFECLMCAKPCTKCLAHIASLSLHSNFMKWDYFKDEKTITLQMRKLRFQVLYIYCFIFITRSIAWNNCDPYSNDKKKKLCS